MSNTQSIAFTPEPEIAARLEKLCQITNLELDELLNALIYSPLKQIIEDGETGLLQAFIKPYRYLVKEDALAVIQNYEREGRHGPLVHPAHLCRLAKLLRVPRHQGKAGQ